MAITTSGTSITFNDATTQTTAPVNTNANVNSVSAGTGISVSSSTGALTVTNAGVTSVAAGTGISVSGSSGSVTVSASGTGTVTSVATGNGLQGGTITTSGTLSLAAPTFNTVGSYCLVFFSGTGPTSGTNYSAGISSNQIASTVAGYANASGCQPVWSIQSYTNNLSGTWKWMAGSGGGLNGSTFGIACRVA